MRTSNLVCCVALSFSFLACAGQEPFNADMTEEDEGVVDSASLALSTTYASLRTGNWSDATMWNPGGVPGAADVVNIGSAHQVTADVAVAASSLKLVDAGYAAAIVRVFLNEDMSVSGSVYIGQGGELDLNDNTLHAGSITMQRGALIPRDPGSRLDVINALSASWTQHIALEPNDTVGSLILGRNTATTSASSNIKNSVTVDRAGTVAWLQLGAPLVLTGAMTTVEAFVLDGGYDISAGSVSLTASGGVKRQGTGKLNVAGNMTVTKGAILDARAGDIVHGNLIGTSWSTFSRGDINVNQLANDMTGLTVDGNLTLDYMYDKSILTLNFDANINEGFDYALAWKGNHVTQLLNWLAPASGQLVVNFPAGITFNPAQHIFYDSATNYTYVGYTVDLCGDGVVNGDEQCDDANANETDGCLSTCEFPALPSLVGQWTFEGANPLAESTGKWGALTLQGNASIINGQLDVNAVVSGNGANATGWANGIGYTGPTIRAKTLVSWVALDNLAIRSGSALTIDNATSDNFDSIVYAERVASRWMAGSTNFMRTQDIVTQDETVAGQLIQMAISYRDLGSGQVQITLCRNGEKMAQYTSGNMTQWLAGNAEVIFGKRHTTSGTNGYGGLDAKIEEARIYAGAIGCDQIGSLQPE